MVICETLPYAPPPTSTGILLNGRRLFVSIFWMKLYSDSSIIAGQNANCCLPEHERRSIKKLKLLLIDWQIIVFPACDTKKMRAKLVDKVIARPSYKN